MPTPRKRIARKGRGRSQVHNLRFDKETTAAWEWIKNVSAERTGVVPSASITVRAGVQVLQALLTSAQERGQLDEALQTMLRIE